MPSVERENAIMHLFILRIWGLDMLQVIAFYIMIFSSETSQNTNTSFYIWRLTLKQISCLILQDILLNFYACTSYTSKGTFKLKLSNSLHVCSISTILASILTSPILQVRNHHLCKNHLFRTGLSQYCD